MRKGGRKVFAKHFARQHHSASRRHTLWKYAGGKKTQNLTHFESTRGLRGRKYLRNIFINGITPHKEQTSSNYGFVDFKNLTLTTITAVPSKSHGALFITDTWGVEDCLYDWGCDDIITVQLKSSKECHYHDDRKSREAWESSQQHEFYSHDLKKGVRKLRPSRRTRFRKLPAATRFPTMQLVLPRWWLRRCTTTHRSPERWPPDIGADDGLLENFPGCWGFHHYPSYPWCPVLHEKGPGREIWSHFSNLVFEAYKTKYCVIKLTQKNIFSAFNISWCQTLQTRGWMRGLGDKNWLQS